MAQTQYASIGCYDCFNKSSSRRGVLVRVRLRVFRVMWTTFQNINLAVQSGAALLSACEAPKPEPVHVKFLFCFSAAVVFVFPIVWRMELCIYWFLSMETGDLPFYQKTAQPNPKPKKSESSMKKTTSNSSVVNDDEEAEYCHPTLLGINMCLLYGCMPLCSINFE